MELIEVVSTTVHAVGYDADTNVMRVAFKSGSTYDYFDVTPALFEQMCQPYPWRRVGAQVRAHAYERIA